jgi:transaldolase
MKRVAKFLLDSADINEIEKWLPFIDGVTTNPILLGRAGTTPMELYGSIKKLHIRNKGFKLFIQVIDTDNLIPTITGTKVEVIYKVPLVKSQYYYITELKQRSQKVCGTMTYDLIQLQMAMNLEVNYNIVLYHKNPDDLFGLDSVNLKEEKKSDVRLIGASFRSKTEVKNAIVDGMDYVTVPPIVMEDCFINHYAEGDYEKIYT